MTKGQDVERQTNIKSTYKSNIVNNIKPNIAI